MTVDINPTQQPVEAKSYLDILRSTALMGASSVVMLVFSLLRSKAVAVLLGPEGVGLISIYGSIADIAQTAAGLGVQSSGVRQVAEAVATGDARTIGRIAFLLKSTSILLGVLGAMALAALALPVAWLTFGDHHHSAAIALLSLAVFFRLASAGQTALLQGLRKVASLARVNMLGALFATLVTIPFVYWLGSDGIAPALVASSVALLMTSSWYARKSFHSHEPVDRRAAFSTDLPPLIKLGFAFMVSGLLTFVGAYVIRLIIVRDGQIAAAGLYQAAWSLGSLYAGFILQAMGTDFYPRLTAVASDHAACNRMVNEQVRISILLAGPGVLATLTFAPFVILLFFSPEFHEASPVLRWICLGMLLRVVSWPLGYIVLAKGKQVIFFAVEVAATVVHLGLAVMLVPAMGAAGAAAAFLGLYVWHSIVILIIVRRMTGFRWSPANLRTGGLYILSAAFIFLVTLWLPLWQATALGTAAVALSAAYSLTTLVHLLPADKLPPWLRRWTQRRVLSPGPR